MMKHINRLDHSEVIDLFKFSFMLKILVTTYVCFCINLLICARTYESITIIQIEINA